MHHLGLVYKIINTSSSFVYSLKHGQLASNHQIKKKYILQLYWLQLINNKNFKIAFFKQSGFGHSKYV